MAEQQIESETQPQKPHSGNGSELSGLVRHCRSGEYSEWEQRVTCCHCGMPLTDNQLVNDGYKLNTVASWAKQQIKIISDMIDENAELDPSKDYYVSELRRISDAIPHL